MTTDARRAAKTAWRDRKQTWTICAVRIGALAWVKLTPNPAALDNRIGFTLRQGAAPVAAMGIAYEAVGTVSVEVLETLTDDLSPMARERVGAERLAHWADALDATPF